MKRFKRVHLSGFVKLIVQPRWYNYHKLDAWGKSKITREISHLESDILHAIKVVEDPEKYVDDAVGRVDYDEIDSEIVEGYAIYEDEEQFNGHSTGRCNWCETKAEAIECVIGEDIPERTPVYIVCYGKHKTRGYFKTFREVVEVFWDNYNDFSCDDLNMEELEYLDKIKYYMFEHNLTHGPFKS